MTSLTRRWNSGKRAISDEHRQLSTRGRRAKLSKAHHLCAGVVLLVATALAGCGATKIVTVTQTATRTVTTTSTRTRTVVRHAAATSTSSAAAPTQQSGSTLTVQDFNGNTLAVKANGLIDPATATDAAIDGPPAGTRLVALVLTLANRGPGTINSDANNNATLVGSDGQDYTPQFAEINECTNFNHGEYTLLNGDSQRGCVVFQLPNGVSVQSVQFSLGNGTAQFNSH